MSKVKVIASELNSAVLGGGGSGDLRRHARCINRRAYRCQQEVVEDVATFCLTVDVLTSIDMPTTKPGRMVRIDGEGISALDELRRALGMSGTAIVSGLLEWLSWQPPEVQLAIVWAGRGDAFVPIGAIRAIIQNAPSGYDEERGQFAELLSKSSQPVDAEMVRRYGHVNRMRPKRFAELRANVAKALGLEEEQGRSWQRPVSKGAAGASASNGPKRGKALPDAVHDNPEEVGATLDRVFGWLARQGTAGGPEHGAVPEAAGRSPSSNEPKPPKPEGRSKAKPESSARSVPAKTGKRTKR